MRWKIYLSIILGIILIIPIFVLADSVVLSQCQSDGIVTLCGLQDSIINILASVYSPPQINITAPLPIYYSDLNGNALTYTVTENSMATNISSCWYNIINSTSDSIISNTTLAGCTNTTFNLPRDDIYNLTLFANNTLGQLNSSTVRFGVYSAGPLITLQLPSDNTWQTSHSVNFTANLSDLNTITLCTIYTNTSGSWNPFYTFFPPITNNGTISVIRTVSNNGYYIWNLWCLDSHGLNNFALNNFRIGVDNETPSVSNINIHTTANSQNVNFDFNSSDVSLNSCNYSVYNSGGTADPLVTENTTINCNSLANSFTVSNYGTYNLRTYVSDLAGNIALNNTSFTVSQSTTPLPGGGGGGTTISSATNFSVLSVTFTNSIDIGLAKDSVVPRATRFIIRNSGANDLDVTLTCIPNNSTNNIDICNYVSFEKSTLKVPANLNSPVEDTVYLRTPENANFNDKYYFTIRAVSSANEFSQLSASARVSYLSLVYKWSYLPAIQIFGISSNSKSFPVIVLSIAIGLIGFFIVFFVISRTSKDQKSKAVRQVIGFFLGISVFIATVIASLILL